MKRLIKIPAKKRVDLAKRYEQQILNTIDFKNLKGVSEYYNDYEYSDTISDCVEVERVYLGETFNIFPSGKHWPSGKFDIVRDTLFNEIFESIVDQHGWSVEIDGTGVFLERII